jgi:hypothetical protein
MKKLLLSAALVALTCAPAFAGTKLPAEMLGPWCQVPEEQQTGHGSTTYARSTKEQVDKDPACIQVTRTDYHGMEDGCKFRRITTRTNGEDYIVYMKCWAAGDDPDKHPVEASIFAMFEGKLKMWPIGCPKC